MLHIENLSVSYGSIKALQEVSCSVSKGEVVALIGANGAGKTTILNTVCGIVPAAAGRIVFEGRDITHLPPHAIVRLGISQVPEGRRIFAGMSVLENLEMGAYSRSSRAEVREQLERVFELFPRLAERRRQPGRTLSGGEQQMLAMGRALMSAPRLLLLDEPSMGLAPLLVEKIFEIIVEISRAGTTLLLVEQNAGTALAVASRAYVLETGRVVLHGPADELAVDPQVKSAYLGG